MTSLLPALEQYARADVQLTRILNYLNQKFDRKTDSLQP
jgi:hypothetical protein